MHYHYTAITFEGWQQLFWETSDRVFCHREVNQYNALLCFTSFRIRDSLQFKCIHITITKHKITIPKITFLIPILTPLLFYPFPPRPYLFHRSYLPSVFIQYISPFLLSSPSIQYLLSFSSFSHLNLAIIFLSVALSPPQVLRNFLCHTSLILPVVLP
jgi:hypothetical protein